MNAKITFPNGTELTTEVNGSCYITDSKPDFPDDLSVVTVQSEDENLVFNNAQLIECFSVDGRYWFSFAETSPMELRLAEYEDAICELSQMF